MSFRSICSVLLVSLISNYAFAINKVGNGGDGIFCKSPGEKKAMLLEFYESNLGFSTKEKNPITIARQQIEKLKTVAPRLYKQYKKRINKISKEIDYKSDISLIDIKDSKHLYKPLSKNCEVLQIAIRKSNSHRGEKRFVFRKDLWERLSPLHKAGLLTHEIIYEHLVMLGEEDSIKARKINGYLYSSAFGKKDFWKLITDLEVAIYP